ncbi:hypothetical protein CHS0354_041116 [Potamilus streckersoni]|uniref:non-specific serine/threonine protein kinase n=1 Tax=Potamilus streckersoni TaxID=2493646 RepID=A0AAE0SE67_9BIVA|nr:hypothetical protein CHS0354_041116 [Potamilus streckersoni]
MRKNKPVKTYGRHRNRVITTEPWLSDSDKKKNIFSTSSEYEKSSHSSIFHISSSQSLSMTNNSAVVSPAVQNKTRKGTRFKNDKENVAAKTRARLKVKNVHNIFSDKHIRSNTGSDSSVGSNECQPPRRVLRERNKNVQYNNSDSSGKETQDKKRKRQPKGVKSSCTEPIKKYNSYNFSDFEEYSLVISNSPSKCVMDDLKKVNGVSCIETSTPLAKRTRCKAPIEAKIKESDISQIECIESPTSDAGSCHIDSSLGSASSSSKTGVEKCNLSSIHFSPSIINSENEKSNSLNKASITKSPVILSPSLPIVQLEKLRDSFISLHISGRRRKQMTNRHNDFFDQSASLFSGPSQSRYGHLENAMSALSIKSQIQNSLGSLVISEGESEDDCETEYGDEVVEEEEVEEDEEKEDDGYDDLSSISEKEEWTNTEEEPEFLDSSKIPLCYKSDETLYMLNDDFSSKIHRYGDIEIIREEEEVENSDASSDTSDEQPHSKSSETLYMFNEELPRETRESSQMIESISEEDHELSCLSGRSVYCTAESSENYSQSTEKSNYHTADDEGTSLGPVTRGYSLRNRNNNSMEESFMEVLTPSKQNGDTTEIVSPQIKLFQQCGQDSGPITFVSAIPDRMMKKCVKIGEGVYGEVFRTQNRGASVALKIIPIEGNFTVNDEPQKTFEEILPEIVISKELSQLRCREKNSTHNFCQVNSVACVKGRYPDHLLEQWDIYNEERQSENDRPDIFTDDQLYIMFEFADGGKDLESFKFENFLEAKSILVQVIYSLAVAEEALQFEHRDLHWGNVLVQRTDRQEIEYKILGVEQIIPSHGVEVSIIDFTLSRLQKDGCTVYCDLAKDETLFAGKGDYQFEVYRLMKEENGNNWELFNPHTNVLWIHYLADKMVYAKRYAQNRREDREVMREFRQFVKEATEYQSALELVYKSHFVSSFLES